MNDNKKKMLAIIAAALVLGLILGLTLNAPQAHANAFTDFFHRLFGGQQSNPAPSTQAARAFGHHAPQSSFSGFGSAFGTGFGTSGFGGLGLSSDRRGLSGWAEEEVGAK